MTREAAAPDRARALWRRGQAGWPRRFPIVQFPNPPLLLAFAGSALAAVADGTPAELGRRAGTVGLGLWAWEEATDGVNWFRRLLGLAGLARIAVALLIEE